MYVISKTRHFFVTTCSAQNEDPWDPYAGIIMVLGTLQYEQGTIKKERIKSHMDINIKTA
jgi:hypothetical protein